LNDMTLMVHPEDQIVSIMLEQPKRVHTSTINIGAPP